MVEPIEFEPVTLAHGNEELSVLLEIISDNDIIGEISLFEFESSNNTNFCLFFLQSMALSLTTGTVKQKEVADNLKGMV